ncbi:hypothetical protein BG006_011274 [Podila minutissima]|uniref:EamA domain-containing protein n=1 Tax=Podila minutissima TaxID=64525 RepID=A0A9P5SCN0_9FUNG|nr:hypothetical protein BG006_011274 [Podila minutissima]
MAPTMGTRYTIGILALLSVVCIWVSSSFLMNNIFGSQKYSKPFFVTYVNTASFSLYLVAPLLRQMLSSIGWSKEKPTIRQSPRSRSYGSTDQGGNLDSSQLAPFLSSTNAVSPIMGSLQDELLEQGHSEEDLLDQPLNNRETAELSFAFCILWFAANWATNASLAYTTVASSTILASLSGFFTLTIGAFLKTETFSTVKLISVCLSLIGVALVSESDRGGHPSAEEPSAPPAPLWGDFLALLSAMFYGCYTVMLKVRIQNESRVNMSLFFGFVGLFNIVLLWPVFGVLHWTGIEPFELPSDTRVIWMIGVNAIVGTLVSDYLWLLSMLMTSPLVVTLGLSLTIPLALLGDIIGYGRVLGLGYWIGAGLVLAGFFGVNSVALTEQGPEEEDREEAVAIQQAASCATAAVAASALIAEERDPLVQPFSRSRRASRASRASSVR